MSRPEFNVFPPINSHGAIGDQRTGALVSADGTIDWLCLSEFDGSPVFGALLDPKKGGFCRLGPARSTLGHQTYIDVLAKAGWPERADAILQKCEAVSGAPGLFAEEIDANQNAFLGNTPQLFSHVEYVRAVIAIEKRE